MDLANQEDLYLAFMNAMIRQFLKDSNIYYNQCTSRYIRGKSAIIALI